MNHLTRRKFLGALAGAGAASLDGPLWRQSVFAAMDAGHKTAPVSAPPAASAGQFANRLCLPGASGMTKYGLVPGKYAPPSYQSDMPAFDRALSDEETWEVLAYIKSSLPSDIRRTQQEVSLEQNWR